MKRFIRYGLARYRAVLSALVALAVLAAVFLRRGPENSATPEPTLPSVEEVYPRREVLHRLIEQPGYIEGFERTDLFARIPGYVREYRADIGDTVRKGQLLAELWVPELVADLHQKEAQVVLERANVEQSKEQHVVARRNVTAATEQVAQARADVKRYQADVERWDSEVKRLTTLAAERVLDQQVLEEQQRQLKSSQALLEASQVAVRARDAQRLASEATQDKSAADVKVAEAGLQVAKAARDHAAAILGYARIEAPYDGVVARRGIDTGTYVQAPPAGDKNGGTALFQVVRTDQVRIFVDVPEADAPFVLDKGPARVQVQALEDREFTGSVTRSSWLLSNTTRTLRVEIDLPNRKGLFRPGMYAYARLPVEHSALTVPASSVFHQDDQDWVVRIVENKAVRTPVRLGLRQGPRVEVLRKQIRSAADAGTWEDFTSADVVVLDNPSTLADDQKVQVRERKAE